MQAISGLWIGGRARSGREDRGRQRADVLSDERITTLYLGSRMELSTLSASQVDFDFPN